MIKKLILLLFLALLLNGCSLFKRKVEIKTSYVEKPELTISDPKPLDLEENIAWVVITKDNQENVFKKMQEEGKDPVLFALSDEQYKTISLNLQRVINYIQLQKDIIAAYRSYYKPSENVKVTK